MGEEEPDHEGHGDDDKMEDKTEDSVESDYEVEDEPETDEELKEEAKFGFDFFALDCTMGKNLEILALTIGSQMSYKIWIAKKMKVQHPKKGMNRQI